MNRKTYKSAVLLFSFLYGLFAAAQVQADDNTERKEISDKIATLVKLLSDGYAEEYKEARGIHIFHAPMGSTIAVAVFTIEGFGAGNNHTQFMAVFATQGEELKERSPRMPSLLDVAAVGGKGRRSVDFKDISMDNRGQDVAINLDTQEYAPDDPMCCPSRKSKTVYVIRPQVGGRLKEIGK